MYNQQHWEDHWQAVYQKHLDENNFQPEEAQTLVIKEWARIEYEISQKSSSIKAPKTWISSLFNTQKKSEKTVKGLYLFGGVGRGKTFLMDLFCEHIAQPVKRYHFHHFMKFIHDELKTIESKEEPLKIIATNFSKNYNILCLDEFMVTDITDAMLLYGLLKHLVDAGVVIITTTNIAPDDLYKDGLQRQQFLPAIDLIKEKLIIHEVSQGKDFRRACLTKHRRFFSPLDTATQKELEQIVNQLSTHLELTKSGHLLINNRNISYVAKSKAVIWFTFAALCEGLRSQLDYIEIAKQFPVIILSDIPILDEDNEDSARRFLILIDELYDQNINLVLSSAVAIEEIYKGKKIQFEFNRLQSRLHEMQSTDYLHKTL